MTEWKRVFTAPAFLAALVVLCSLNVWLFVRISTLGSLTGEDGVYDPASHALYLELLDQYRSEDYETAHEELSLLAEAEEILEEFADLSALSAQMAGATDAGQYWEEVLAPQYEAAAVQYDELLSVWSDLLSDEDLTEYVKAAKKLDAQFVHLLDYPSYLRQIQENAKKLSETSIFRQEGSYSLRNSRKTAQDFLPLEETNLQPGNEDAVTMFFSWRAGDYFLMLFLAIVAMLFRRESECGLSALVWSGANGRGRLAIHRVFIMLAASVVACLLLYGGVLAAGFALYGGTEGLGRAAQSAVALFRQYTHLDTMAGAIARFFVVRVITAFELGLVIWLFTSLFRSGTFRTAVCLVALVSAEYLAYTRLPSNSIWQLAKYLNLFTLTEVGSWFPGYHNLNVLGFPVSLQASVTIQAIPASVLLATSSVSLSARRYPVARGGLMSRLCAVGDALSTRMLLSLRLLGQELWKLLAHQHGWAVLVGAIAAACVLPFSANVSHTLTDWVLLEYQGPVTENTRRELSSGIRDNEEVMGDFALAEEKYAAGEMDTGEYYELLTQAIYAGNNLEALTEAQGILQTVSDRCNELGSRPWLVDQIPFERVYGEAAARIRYLRSMLLLLSVCLLLHSAGAMERKRGLMELLKSTPDGRSQLVLCKLTSAAVCLACLWLPNMVGEVHAYLSLGGAETLDAPIQAILPLYQLSLRCSIRAFLILIYCARFMVLFSLGCIVVAISFRLRRNSAALLTALTLLVLPSALWLYFELPFFSSFSTVRLLDFIELATKGLNYLG